MHKIEKAQLYFYSFIVALDGIALGRAAYTGNYFNGILYAIFILYFIQLVHFITKSIFKRKKMEFISKVKERFHIIFQAITISSVAMSYLANNFLTEYIIYTYPVIIIIECFIINTYVKYLKNYFKNNEKIEEKKCVK